MLCTKCGKDFNTQDNRCPECGAVYSTKPPVRPSEIGRYPNSNAASEFIGHHMVRNTDGKWLTLLRVLGVFLAGAVIYALFLLLDYYNVFYLLFH
ncbi:MAG: hypothetical protein J6C51_00990 [Clostridia bacterium]|nr:hypothetical protein [Clostridia bacterium]